MTRAKIDQFRALFLKWNAKINLSAARRPDEVDEQISDSLEVVDWLRGARTVLDVGSGGGFPVVLAAIALPEVAFTSLEPVHKKHAFLRTAARELALPNLDAHALRLDDHDVRSYDVATSRATFDLREWLERGSAFVRPGGAVIGFEALQRDDLPAGTERRPYGDGAKRRALVRYTRPT